MARLTGKQKRFVDEYLIDLNATQAAIRTGYSQKTAYSIGQKLLKKAEIKLAIDDMLDEMHTQKVADVQEVLEYLTSVMRGEQTEEAVVVEGCGEGVSSARKVDKAVGARERLKAAELIGKRHALFTDTVQITGEVVQIVDDIPDG